jgi:hypothetical protein
MPQDRFLSNMVSLEYCGINFLVEGGWNLGWFRDNYSNSVLMCICDYVVYLQGDAPPNSSRDPKVGPRAKQQKKKKVWACSLTHNTSGVGRCVGVLRWD